MKRTRVHTQYFTRLLQPLVFFLSLSHSPLSSLSHCLSPLLTLLALLSFPKCFYRSIFTEVFSQSSLYSSFSRNVTSPKQSHRNQITKQWPLAPNLRDSHITRANVSRRVTFFSKTCQSACRRVWRVRATRLSASAHDKIGDFKHK
jgi:hypothetical protein